MIEPVRTGYLIGMAAVAVIGLVILGTQLRAIIAAQDERLGPWFACVIGAALVWPIAVPVAIGYLIGLIAKRGKRARHG